MVIAPGKASAYDQNLEIPKTPFTLDEAVEMDALDVGAGDFKGVGGLSITVEAKTG
jgi:hypothetical protein